MTPAQARMARALCKMALYKFKGMNKSIGISPNSINKFENAVIIPSEKLQINLQRYYESMGCVFTENGVEPSKKRGSD
jgi:hypothetical protein